MKTPHNFFNEELLDKIKQPIVLLDKSQSERVSSTQAFVVGLSMGNHNTSDQRSFSGWGMFMAEEKPDGNVFEYNQYNNMFNCDTVEATLNGVAQTIERLKNEHRIEIVMQDAYLPLLIADAKFASSEEEVVNSKNNQDSSYWRTQRRLKIYDRIMAAVHNSTSIESISFRYSPPERHCESILGKQLFADKDGIEIAAASAYEGYRKAIRGSFYFLVNNEGKRDLGSSIVTLRKNLNNSYESTKEFLTFLSSYSDLSKNLHLVSKVLRPQLSPILDKLLQANTSQEIEAVFANNKQKILKVLEISDEYAEKEADVRRKGFVPDLVK